MQRRLHELTIEETRAVIGGAILPQPATRRLPRSALAGKAA
jgi:hypothetical protein